MTSQFSARWWGSWVSELQFCMKMFVDEFMFSFSLLAFAGWLFLLGTVILFDAFRRFAKQWSKSASKKKSSVVLVVDIGRPVTNGVGDGAKDLVQGPIAMPEKKAS
jgi:hypothetical protein